MADRDRGRDRDRARDRERDKDRIRDRDRDLDVDRKRDRDDRDRHRDRERSKRSRSRTLSPYADRRRSRSYTPDAKNRHNLHQRRHHPRSPNPESPSRTRRKDEAENQKDRQLDGNVKEKQKNNKERGGSEGGNGTVEGEKNNAVIGVVDADELEMMKLSGIPVGFNSTKGKPVPGNDVGAVRKVSKRKARQYMNRLGGFNRPLSPEKNK